MRWKIDPFTNPYSPGARAHPPELVGRDDIPMQAEIPLGRAIKTSRKNKYV